MNIKEKQNIAFYQGNSVHAVLERFEVSEDKKKIIYAVIFSAKTENEL